jgi:uroporphyrinogen decarboxylase
MADHMTARQRVLTALNHQEPDRVPRYDYFWPEFIAAWRAQKRLPPPADPADDLDIATYYGIDFCIAAADESPWPSRARTLKEGATEVIRLDGWGRTERIVPGAVFSEWLSHPVGEETDPEHLRFDSPSDDNRYRSFLALVAARREAQCVFAKTGGPFQRACQLRGEVEFLMDLVSNPGFARALLERVTDHLIQIGLESLRRGDLYETGIWIYDDIGTNERTIMGPRTYEKMIYPYMKRMCQAYKEAGAAKIIFHSDGRIEDPILDLLLDCGVDGIQPVEPKAGMDVVRLRRKYGHRLALLGGMDNAHLLPRGDRAEIARAVAHVLSAGHGGGLAIGSHSIGPDISVETYDYYHRLVQERGHYPLAL